MYIYFLKETDFSHYFLILHLCWIFVLLFIYLFNSNDQNKHECIWRIMSMRKSVSFAKMFIFIAHGIYEFCCCCFSCLCTFCSEIYKYIEYCNWKKKELWTEFYILNLTGRRFWIGWLEDKKVIIVMTGLSMVCLIMQMTICFTLINFFGQCIS